MRLTLSNDQVMVFDDFLPPESFAPLLGYTYSADFRFVHEDAWHKAWKLTDGLPLLAPGTYYRDDGDYEPGDLHYPTGTPLDRLLEAVRSAAGGAEAIVGKSGVHWKTMTAHPFLHPRGTGLSLHRDHSVYTGSWIFYVHHEWDVHWGGHLLVLDPRTGAGIDLNDAKFYAFLSDENQSRLVSEPGIALCIPPKPNRLVFLNENAYHMITRVDADAGDRPRVTLSGFFVAEGR